MKVLLTGAGGFLGRHVARSLARHYLETVALGRTRPEGFGPERFIQADLLSRPALTDRLREAGVTHLVHLAWVTGHGEFWDSEGNFEWVDASLNLVRAFGEAGGRHVVVAGSCAEYDWSHGLCREHSTPLAPATVYGTAKDATRRLLTALCESRGLSLAWGRIFLTHGEGEDPRRLVPSLIEALTGRRAPFGVNHAAWRDYLHASDLAEGLVTLLRFGAHGAYNISSGQPQRLGDLVRLLAARLGVDPSPVLALNGAARRGEPPLLVGENQRLAALGWRMRHSMASALDETISSLGAGGARPMDKQAEGTP